MRRYYGNGLRFKQAPHNPGIQSADSAIVDNEYKFVPKSAEQVI